jgi:hypothetical protein
MRLIADPHPVARDHYLLRFERTGAEPLRDNSPS